MCSLPLLFFTTLHPRDYKRENGSILQVWIKEGAIFLPSLRVGGTCKKCDSFWNCSLRVCQELKIANRALRIKLQYVQV